jgi:hypothetical protein
LSRRELRGISDPMYRQHAALDPQEQPPAELVVALAESERRSSAVAFFQFFSIPLAVCVLLSWTSPTMGLVGLVAAGAFSLWRWRRRSRGRTVVLQVASRELCAHAHGRTIARVGLGDLEDVSLDTKTIRPVREATTMVYATRFIDSKVGLEVDVARIVLSVTDPVSGEGRSVPLHDTHVAHMTAIAWLGKIRSFLRRHDWRPIDEREVDGDA